MAQKSSFFEYKTKKAEKMKIGALAITPETKTLKINWPGGGLVWNRPTAILIEENGQVQRLPVRNVTLLVQLGLVGLSIGMFILLTVLLNVKGRKKNE